MPEASKSLRDTFEESVRLGFTKWDTAAVYGMGSCEKLLGKFLKGHDDIFLSTKYFPNKKFRTGDLEKSFEESMTRLGLNFADLYWIHKPINLKENLKDAIPLLKDGHIKSIGISNVSMQDIKMALKKVLNSERFKIISACLGMTSSRSSITAIVKG